MKHLIDEYIYDYNVNRYQWSLQN
ncbi:MAG: hypothetical protein ACE3JQ_01895 [Paenisporosarcina sp.]